MKRKIVVQGPVFSVSGYGEQARLALRALRTREDLFDIYVFPINWGKTGWQSKITEERAWIDELVMKTALYASNGGKFDVSLQITIPNEWTKMAPVNIGYTAGIETTQISPQWIEKSRLMDRIIVVSEHSKNVYENTVYEARNRNNGEIHAFKCETPIDVVPFNFKDIKPDSSFKFDLDYDFNYLTVSQWSTRKNLENTIRWFLEECYDQEVGLVVKASMTGNSIPDRYATVARLTEQISRFDNENKNLNRKCKVYLLHGDLTESQIQSLYKHPKIKSYVSLTHGEGFGLPLFEAAYNGLPIITPGWSGHLDYLYVPVETKDSFSYKELFQEVDYTLGPIQKEAVWKGVLEAHSHWCYPIESSYKMALREIRKDYKSALKKAKILKKHIRENYSADSVSERFIESLVAAIEPHGTTELDLESVMVL